MKAIALLAFAAGSALAADVSGIWVGQVAGRQGQMLDVAFQLVQTGAAVSGKLYGDYRSSPIVEGSVSGDEVKFVVVVAEQAGNQINETRHLYSGTLKDGTLELTRVREGAKSAGNGGVEVIKGNNKTEMKLKRLY